MNIERPASKQPMPDHARRVFRGEVFDVYQWEQEMFDGSKAVFEKLIRQDTVIIYTHNTMKPNYLCYTETDGKAQTQTKERIALVREIIEKIR